MKANTQIDLELLRRRLAPLKAVWGRQAKRIDALSLRERLILFLSLVAVLAALFDTLVLTPLSARAKLRVDARAQQATELSQLREQFIAAGRSRGSDPAAQLRLRLDTAQTERLRLDTELRQGSSLSGNEGLSPVLQRLLSQQPGLVLDRLTLLDDTPVTAPAAPAAPTALSPAALATGASAPVAAAPAVAPLNRVTPPAMPGMAWQGVELQVQGSYRDIQRYLQALERELPALRWGEMRLSTPGPTEAPRLVAQVFLLKVQP
jgi:MSHA biogenesis protein MshJ